MLGVANVLDVRSPTNRAKITNGSRLLPGTDGRSASARRYRDLIADFGRDLGAFESLSTAELAMVRQAAALVVKVEQLQVGIVNGDVIDTDELVRLMNASTRILLALGVKRRKREAPMPLRERLAGGGAP
jgi:hypothetical protein